MENLQDQIQQARALERAHKNDAALDVFLRLSADEGAHQDDPAFWFRLGDLGRRTDRPEVAAEAYPRAIDLLERAGHPNSALAVARRFARMNADSPSPHLRLGTLGAALGYGRYARDGYLRALDLAERDETREETIEGLRAAWALLRRGGRHDEAEELRARILDVQPGADPLDDPTLDVPDPLAAAAELPALEETADPGDAAPAQGLQPTVVPGATSQPDVAKIEGLEPTSAGDEWGPDRGSDPSDDEDELPGHADLPLLGTGPEVEDVGAEDPLPLVGFVPTAAEAEEDAADEEREAGDLPLLSENREPASVDVEDARDRPTADLQTDAAAAQPSTSGSPAPSSESAPAPAPPAADESSEAAPRRGGSRGEPDGGYIDLGALILGDDEEDVTRFQIEAQPPSGDEDQDFAEILSAFRQQVSEKIDPADSESHYDLGLAFKDMGLFDDAIGQLQVALRGGSEPVSTLEVLGECFIEKGEHSLATRVLERATQIPGRSDSDMIGVLYWLGRTQAVLENPEVARGYYERVVAVDIGFRDAGARLESLRSIPGSRDDT